MRNVVPLARHLFFGAFVAVAGVALGGQVLAGERRVIETPDADYPGFDYETVKDVTLEACRSTCLEADQCRAFTYNVKAGWCFLKSDYGVLADANEAIAGRVVESVDLTPALEEQRLAELDFVPGSYIDEARTQASGLKSRFDPAGAAYDALRTQGAAAYRAGSFARSVSLFGRALAIADDNPGLWLDFAIASRARSPENWSEAERARIDTTAAGINAYVRSDEVTNEAKALAMIGDGFRAREIWKPAYRAYRASLSLRENAAVRTAYEEVIAEHGFRIVSHEVDADVANPRICVVFSDDLPVSQTGLTDYVVVDGHDDLAIEPAQRQICVDGVEHGNRYTVRIRSGLPAADGETLAKATEINVFVRDRAPWVGFAGNAYVLPAGEGASLPLTSVNTDIAEAAVYRIGERGLATALRDDQVLTSLAPYSAQTIADARGEKIWEGEIVIESELNQTITTAVPIGEALPSLKPGIYAVTARAELDPDEWGKLATQWFIISDLGMTTLSGSDGVHVFIRSLSSAEPIGDVKLRLVATNNDILGEATTDAEGYARFEPGLARGTGGSAPQMVDATTAEGDFAFLDLTRSAFDLSDRGVEGRTAPGPLDVFLTPERGIYRPGETVHLTALVRDARADAVDGLPITLVIERPDGVEFLKQSLSDSGLGGYTASVPLDDAAMRGSWQVRLFADPEGRPVAETAILVEDFVPERLAFDLTTDAEALSASRPITVDLEARYLYGATAPGLSVDGDIDIRPVDTIDRFPGYTFGLAEDTVEPIRRPIDLAAVTDEEGRATLSIGLPDLPVSTHPFAARTIVRLTDTNGRAVERTLALPVTPETPLIGIKPQFEGDEVEEGASAGFDVILVSSDGERIAGTGLTWTLDRIETEYQWYRSNGNWNYELITTPQRVESGEIEVAADDPASVSATVDWGRYRLTVQRLGDSAAATSFDFYAGWYVSSSSSETPDVLSVALDKPAYRVGETAKLRLDPRFAGIALVSVVDDRLIATQAVSVPEDGTTVDLAVTEQWGPGAYVTAALYRPMDLPAKRMPARALGLTWAKVAPGDRDLDVTVGVADEMRPRQPMTIPVAIENLSPGSEAYVTVAAVDVGILNLTGFEPPAPDDWYFGQRKLGMEIRDLYGLLIDRMQGVPGAIRSGGDGGAVRLAAPPPTEKLVAFYSGIVAVDEAGKATVSFDMPEFNGTVRVMVMAWSRQGVGHVAKDVLVRDPVVVSASVPRFLRTGDTSRLLVEINNVAGPAGDYRLTVVPGAGIGIASDLLDRTVTLEEKGRTRFNVPIAGELVGDHTVAVNLEMPGGNVLGQELALGVRPPGEPVTRRNIVSLSGEGTLTIDAEAMSEFVPATGSVAVSIGGAGRLDVAGILAALDRYPYGCTEQLTSRALPLVYLDDVAATIGVAADTSVRERVQKAIGGVLANQAANGSFGLWRPTYGGNLWLDAYVTDFLVRADEKGYDVPEVARRIALDNLSNRIAYADDFERGGEDIAYALYVLARSGKASIGDLRYYVETKIDNFGTALAKAQIGAALALYGDRRRSADAFEAAFASLRTTDAKDAWRGNYGSSLRDKAAVLALAAENDIGVGDLRALASDVARIDEQRRYTSTQENAWMLLAAAALIKDAERTSFEIEGAAVSGPLYKEYWQEQIEASPVSITNLGNETLDAIVATTGVTVVPEPAGGEGFTIKRAYYTPSGEPMDIGEVAQNQRVVVVLSVIADQDGEGQLMVVDPVPAGYEIENPNISASGDVTAFNWLNVERNIEHTEARTDRFVAALNRRDNDPLSFDVAYAMRAVSPGTFALPGATVEDMYRPYRRARSASRTVEVVGTTR